MELHVLQRPASFCLLWLLLLEFPLPEHAWRGPVVQQPHAACDSGTGRRRRRKSRSFGPLPLWQKVQTGSGSSTIAKQPFCMSKSDGVNDAPFFAAGDRASSSEEQAITGKERENAGRDDGAARSKRKGQVVRVAGRTYHPEHSKPSSRQYTTRKTEHATVRVTRKGIVGDYNNYRTYALNGTADRAVSIVTTDSIEWSKRKKYPVAVGDLGENLSVDGVDYTYFVPGRVYGFYNGDSMTNPIGGQIGGGSQDVVVLEITEPIAPCANLCKLPYINDARKSPGERIAACQEFLKHLDAKPGIRGWLAKVLQEGSIAKGATVVEM